MTGTVIYFCARKGYGFIRNPSGGPDVFVHYSSIEMDGYKELHASDQVSYQLEIGPKGKHQATAVRVIGGE